MKRADRFKEMFFDIIQKVSNKEASIDIDGDITVTDYAYNVVVYAVRPKMSHARHGYQRGLSGVRKHHWILVIANSRGFIWEAIPKMNVISPSAAYKQRALKWLQEKYDEFVVRGIT